MPQKRPGCLRCAAAIATLELVRGGLMQNAARMGEHFMLRLQELQARHAVIGEVRGRGLMIGMELVTDRHSRAAARELCDRFINRAYENGLLLLSCGQSTVRFMPPLTVNAAEIDEAVAILDEVAVAKFFAPGDNPIGQRIRDVEPGLISTVVGVVGAVKNRDLAEPEEGAVYHAASQKAEAAMTFTVKSASESLSVLSAARHVVARVDPLIPLARISTMEQWLADSLARRRLAMQLIVFFGLAAILLAATGLYGVLSFAVEQRRREMGIRMALGARPGQIVGLIARHGSLPVALGLFVGLTVAAAFAKVLASSLYGVRPHEIAVYAAVACLTASIATAAILIPAGRASSLDPCVTLREE